MPNQSGRATSLERQLINALSVSGNFEQAKLELTKLENLLNSLKRVRDYSTYGPQWESQYESARGIYFSYQGQWIESERSLRKAIQLLKSGYANVKGSSSKINELDNEENVESDSQNNSRGYITQLISRQLNLSLVLLQQRKLIDS
ncbi:hypothetical protein [Polynucleobacter sp.]|uniref:hypothetical protein n=1 Tax=Polynucleobacter sp. TaxID=2029855 RepID=UPI003341E035